MQWFSHKTPSSDLTPRPPGPPVWLAAISPRLLISRRCSSPAPSLPWMPFPDLSPQGRRRRGPCLRWSKLSLATGTVPSLPSCYQSAITFPLFDFVFFFPRGTVRDSHNYVSSNPIPIPPACSPVGGQVGAWSPHDGLLGG